MLEVDPQVEPIRGASAPDPGEDAADLARRRRRRLALLAILPAIAVAAAPAMELDSFTDRHEILAFPEGSLQGRPVSDFSDEFDREVNRIFAEVLAELNADNSAAGRSCGAPRARSRLYRKLSNALGGPVVVANNRLRPVITRHPKSFKTLLEHSIYRDFPAWGSPSLGLISKFSDKMAPAFRFDLEETLAESGGRVVLLPGGRLAVAVGGAFAGPVFPSSDSAEVTAAGDALFYPLATGQALVDRRGRITKVTPIIIGSDKISHFFNRGLKVFQRLRASRGTADGAGLEQMLRFNMRLEDSVWGAFSTGVAAYGDLVANFQGMRFWIHLLEADGAGGPIDPLVEEPAGSYVRCSPEGRWLQERQFTLHTYLDAAWDEGLNCARFRSPKLLDLVERRMEDLRLDDPRGRRYECPMSSELIRRAAERYGPLADRLINAEGFSSMRERRFSKGDLPDEPAARTEQTRPDLSKR